MSKTTADSSNPSPDPKLFRRIIGTPGSWLSPFSALRQGVSELLVAPGMRAQSFLSRSVSSVWRSVRKVRWGFGLSQPPIAGALVFGCLAMIYAATAHWVDLGICLLAIILPVFVRATPKTDDEAKSKESTPNG